MGWGRVGREFEGLGDFYFLGVISVCWVIKGICVCWVIKGICVCWMIKGTCVCWVIKGTCVCWAIAVDVLMFAG